MSDSATMGSTSGEEVGDTTSGGPTTSTGVATDDDTTSGTTEPEPGTTGDDTSTTTTTGDGPDIDIGGEPNVLYVHPSGQNANPGTIEAPMRTIQWAIARAEEQGNIDTIRAAEGTYSVDYATGAHIKMISGISLYGGYRSDWGAWDPFQYESTLVDASLMSLPSSDQQPHRAVEIPLGVSAATTFSGFHVQIARGKHRAGIFMRGDATIIHNTFEPVVDNEVVVAHGLRVYQGIPKIVRNRFRFKVAEANTAIAVGLSAFVADATVGANLFDMTGPGKKTFGLHVSGGKPKVLGNTIYLDNGSEKVGLFLVGGTAPVIDNNLIESATNAAICLYLDGNGTTPAEIRNNVLQCNNTLYGTSPMRSWLNAQDLEANEPNASDNVKPPAPILKPATGFRLDAQFPCTVTKGGRDISAALPHDLDGTDRTVPLSIGAYEWDGNCK